MYYRVLIVSIDNRFKITRYFEAENSLSLLEMLKKYPGLDLKHLGYEVVSIQAIQRDEYEQRESGEDPSHGLRTNARFIVNESCRLEPDMTDSELSQFLSAETIDYSVGGIKLTCHAAALPGNRLRVSIDNLNIFRKEASVIWSEKRSDGSVQAGLRWV